MALILIKYGTDHPVEKLKIDSANPDDSVVLIQNGIFWTIDDRISSCRGKVYVIHDDLVSRGYREADCSYPVIDYARFVELAEKNPQFIG